MWHDESRQPHCFRTAVEAEHHGVPARAPARAPTTPGEPGPGGPAGSEPRPSSFAKEPPPAERQSSPAGKEETQTNTKPQLTLNLQRNPAQSKRGRKRSGKSRARTSRARRVQGKSTPEHPQNLIPKPKLLRSARGRERGRGGCQRTRLQGERPLYPITKTR